MTSSTGTRARTRQAILDAAIVVLSQNPGASLADIAVAAEVGRTTLHRYFAERSDLLKAISAEIGVRLDRATTDAELESGTGAAAMLRLCTEYFQLGSLLSLIFADPESWADESTWEGSCDPRFTAMVERGHGDGTIDAQLPVDWLQSTLWAQLYAAWSYAAETGASRHRVLALVTRTISGSIAPGR